MPKRKNRSDDDSAPKPKALYTLKLDAAQRDKLGALLEEKDWEPYDVDHAAFAFKGHQVNVVAYQSGKLVIQGKQTEAFVRDVLEPEITGEARLGYEAVHHPDWFEPHAGLDESGKGDLFGPLVSACVIGDGPMVETWLAAGIQDSKKVTDRKILQFDKLIRETDGVVVETVQCGMAKYNELMAKPRANLNRLLAWQHARALEAALKKRSVPRGLLDQFSRQRLVDGYFKEVPESFVLDMRTRAESDPVVAAASVVARAEYVRKLKELSDQAGEELLKGAGAAVKAQATRLVERDGPDALGRFAKLHFKTAYEARGLKPPEKPAWNRNGGR
jgi:ribonuclease HIII